MRRPTNTSKRVRAALRHIATGAARWVYLQEGNGPPLILVHGLSGSTRWWDRNVGALAERFTVYAVELQGFASNRGRVMEPRASAAALAGFMDLVAIPRAHIVGHSMGGHISLHLAATYPEKVDRLVLAAPSGLIRRGLLSMFPRLALSSLYGALDFAPTIALDALRAGPLNLFLAARGLLKDNVEASLASIRAPTLVVAAERDALVPPELCATVAAGIKGAELVELRGAGHNLMWDRADDFNTTVLEFLLRSDAADA